MNRIYIILLLCASACRKEEPELDLSPHPVTPVNLVQNGSFELNGMPSLNHWSFPYELCCPDTFSMDAPAGGGSWSLLLRPQWSPAEGAAETCITGLSPGIFLLKFSAKCMGAPPLKAYASLYIKGPLALSSPVITFSDSVWTNYQLTTGMMPLTPADTLAVRISAGSTEVMNWTVLFDNVQVYKLP